MLEGKASEIGLAVTLGTRGLVSYSMLYGVGNKGSVIIVAGEMTIKIIGDRLDWRDILRILLEAAHCRTLR